MIDGAHVNTDVNQVPLPGAVGWLDVAADKPAAESGRARLRYGPLGLQISPLRKGHEPYFFKGARLRGTRSVWSASTVSGAELFRAPRTQTHDHWGANINLLARVEASGSVFDPVDSSAGTLQVYEPVDEICQEFPANTHLFTLNIPVPSMGIDAGTMRDMREHVYDLTPFQTQLLRGAVGLLLVGGDELNTSSSLVGVDRYLAALAALLLRTAVQRPNVDLAQIEQLRMRTDAIIVEQSTDPKLTPAAIATQLNVSLRQLYRAFSGTESPAARIRRHRLERAAEILAARTGPGQVERVAAECGFVSAEYFSRAFRREFGLSPRAYRAAHRDAPRPGLRASGSRG